MALYLDGQKIVSGGSGSGGHTIVDNEGVSLEQRTNLQFNGAYSEDNSTDDTTEVNIVREMTKAEFDLLSADEKVGLINITDITGGNDDRFQPVIYSEDEWEIGVWLDGKPLYQKSYAGNLGGPETSKVIDSNIKTDSGIYEVKSIGGIWAIGSLSFATTTLQNFGVMGSYSAGSETAYVKITSNGLTVSKVGSDFGIEYIVTIQYTKTTDTAGSGQWTPQGVPTHHYSTDEQVVGTWIDGSTIYEKTFTSTIEITNGAWVNIENLSSLNIDTVVNIEGVMKVNEDGDSIYRQYPLGLSFGLMYNEDTKYVMGRQNVLTQISGKNFTEYYTIKYTKSST